MIELTKMKNGYDGKPTRLEVQDFDPFIHDGPEDGPGIYLQHVDGCGYTPYELTADQAEALAKEILEKVAESRKAFEEKEPKE